MTMYQNNTINLKDRVLSLDVTLKDCLLVANLKRLDATRIRTKAT